MESDGSSCKILSTCAVDSGMIALCLISSRVGERCFKEVLESGCSLPISWIGYPESIEAFVRSRRRKTARERRTLRKNSV
jgi:hypothetical protein